MPAADPNLVDRLFGPRNLRSFGRAEVSWKAVPERMGRQPLFLPEMRYHVKYRRVTIRGVDFWISEVCVKNLYQEN